MQNNEFERQIKAQLKSASARLENYRIDESIDEAMLDIIDNSLNSHGKESSSRKPYYMAIAASILLVFSFMFFNTEFSTEVSLSTPVVTNNTELSKLIAASQMLESSLAKQPKQKNSIVMLALNTEIKAIDSVLSSLYQEGSSDDLKSIYWNKRIEKLESIRLLVSLKNQQYERI